MMKWTFYFILKALFVLKVLLTLQFVNILFFCIMILTYQLYQKTSFKIFFCSRIIEKERVFNIRLPRILLPSFLESLFLHVSFKFHSNIWKRVIIGTMLICACANNYWKSVNGKYLAYILEYSKKRNIIKGNIYDGVHFLMLLLIAECNFTEDKFLLQTFSNKSSKIDYQWNITITYFARLHRILSAKLFTNPLRFHPSRRLVPVQGFNLALSPDKCNA